MERALILLALIFSINAHAVIPVGAPMFSPDSLGTTGGKSAIPLNYLSLSSGKVFSIYAGDAFTAMTAGAYSPFLKEGIPYQVTAGMYAHCFNGSISTGAVSRSLQWVQATATFAHNASGISPGSFGSYQMGAPNRTPPVQTTAANTPQNVAGEFTFSPTYWPGFQADTGTSQTFAAHMDCFESAN